jgi:hypothetical protein
VPPERARRRWANRHVQGLRQCRSRPSFQGEDFIFIG